MAKPATPVKAQSPAARTSAKKMSPTAARTAVSKQARAVAIAAGNSTPVTSSRRASFTVPGLSAGAGTRVAEQLQKRLVSLVDLSLTLKHIHWNVVGPSFIGVHEMLDPQYHAVVAMVDDLAERIATLGGVPSALPQRIEQDRTWDDYSLDRADALSHLGALDVVYVGVITDQRSAIERVGEDDPISEDLLVSQCAQLERFHWFVRSHLTDWAGGLANAGSSTELGAAGSVAAKSRRSRA